MGPANLAKTVAADMNNLKDEAPPIVKRNWNLAPYVAVAIVIGVLAFAVLLATHGAGGPPPHVAAG